MKTKMVRKEIDLQNLPPLTDEQRVRLDALAKMPDSEIDYDDIPPLGDEFWKNAVRNPFYKPVKQVTTVRVDSDVLLWLKSRGKGYQTRINAILRDAMLHSMQPNEGEAKADGALSDATGVMLSSHLAGCSTNTPLLNTKTTSPLQRKRALEFWPRMTPEG